jgi:hypothetical protein
MHTDNRNNIQKKWIFVQKKKIGDYRKIYGKVNGKTPNSNPT